VEDIAIDVICAEVFERARHGLRDLVGETSTRVVRQAVILAIDVGEFGLQKELGSRDDALVVGLGQCFANARFKVVAPLIRSIDAPESGPQREQRECGSSLLLPSSSIEECRA
jgi:hypothetical protein